MSEETKIIPNQVIFIILNILFFAAMLFLVVRALSTDARYENLYAKKISLLIDEARENTELKIDITELLLRADKNKFNVQIETQDNEVFVKITEKGGYKYKYFSDLKVESIIDRQNRDLILKFNQKDDIEK